ncbi:unnamed protein product [Allacma fusca]|uniref:Uncharacterized protein n=1 Tax=Allacma fusca TaxID=39272 RepID=A0A8J2NRT6_9HEXA|nr:unnamed protein product [Allacma fusca]
MDTEEKETR